MKINLIVILSIIFYTTTLLGSGKEQIVKKVVSYTKEKTTPSTEYILNTFEDKRLKVDEGVLVRFNNCLLYTSPSPRDCDRSRMPSSA